MPQLLLLFFSLLNLGPRVEEENEIFFKIDLLLNLFEKYDNCVLFVFFRHKVIVKDVTFLKKDNPLILHNDNLCQSVIKFSQTF